VCLWKSVARRGLCAYGRVLSCRRGLCANARVLPGEAYIPMEGCCQEGHVCLWKGVARKGLPMEGYCHEGSVYRGVLPEGESP
jgi:hypothetical protein